MPDSDSSPETAEPGEGAADTSKVTAEKTPEAIGPRKRVRQRKKQLYERIQRQMEFYFSEANLAKDRYLGELTRTGTDGVGTGEVPLDAFLKFNKIRAMTQDAQDIAKAIKSSGVLVCSEDNTKVRRRDAVEAYDADARTVYVESIPATASRDWLTDIFKDYGTVAYISLPKFKGSQKIKGYAFIEFNKPEDAVKCLNAFSKMGCRLPTCMPPEELSTIKLFAVEEPPGDQSADATPTEEKESPMELKVPESPNKGKKRQFRYESVEEMKLPECSNKDKGKKREFRYDSTDEQLAKKKKRHNKHVRRSTERRASEQSISDRDASSAAEESEKTLNTSEDAESKEEMSSQDEMCKRDSESTEKKKKNRKRSAKERTKSKKGTNKNEAPKGALWGLQVLSKPEWKALRNKYLNLQRKRMKELKQSLRAKGIHHVPVKRELANKTDKDADGRPKDAEKRVPGVFVGVELPEPCLDVRETKRSVRTNVHVQHVDVREGRTEMVVRFDEPAAAKQFCESGIYASARVLNDAESAEQWERAEAARGEGKRLRGRNKLLQRAGADGQRAATPNVPVGPATHVRFDE